MNLLSIAGWITDSFPIIRIVLISLIVIILFQPSSSSGMGALSGQRDTFYSKDKSKSLESVMKKITIVLGIAEGVLAILFFVTLIIYRG